ncbi:alpha-L-arabinofuranosidase [Aureococcus anophagefferens]|nr:alpha-L-arabinofuranosidase [Aureococcus anophagefferens]
MGSPRRLALWWSWLACVRATRPVGPCDIFAAGGTPCVAAHSVARALYANVSGPLYEIRRASDNATTDVPVLADCGIVDASVVDAFCDRDCTITKIYDQSPMRNDLSIAPARRGFRDLGVNATRRATTVGGRTVYAAVFEQEPLATTPKEVGVGYRNDNTTGIATGDDPETLYMVVAGDHYNGACCFDYGNAEDHIGDERDPSIAAVFVTAMVKGDAGDRWAVKGGAADGALATLYDGARPRGYAPMKKQGGLILGIGGDNSHGAVGTFFEGAVTAGYSSDDIDARVQASIAAASYGH